MEVKKHIVIVGGGMAGLASAWYVQKQDPHCCITILEEKEMLGGHVQTNQEEYILEQGPRVFKASKSVDFLQLIEEIGFSSSVIFSSKLAKKRYLWTDAKLRSICSTVFFDLCRSLLKERKIPPCDLEETVWDFAVRRLGRSVAEKLIDPIILGIYAGDTHTMSVDACFPKLKEWERKYGSLTKAFFSRPKRSIPVDTRLFSFRQGAFSFITHLAKQLHAEVSLKEKVHFIEQKDAKYYIVHTSKRDLEVDRVIIAAPAYAAAEVVETMQPSLATALRRIPYASVTVVNIVLEGKVLRYPGFGYLVPSKEKEDLLGVMFDSQIFPDQENKEDTKLTLMIRGSDHSPTAIQEIIQRCLCQHLQIQAPPKKILIHPISQAIPQYILGHQNNIALIRNLLPSGIELVGNYLEGVSLSDTIRVAKQTS